MAVHRAAGTSAPLRGPGGCGRRSASPPTARASWDRSAADRSTWESSFLAGSVSPSVPGALVVITALTVLFILHPERERRPTADVRRRMEVRAAQPGPQRKFIDPSRPTSGAAQDDSL